MIVTSAALLYVVYVHYFSEEEVTVEWISPSLARALGPRLVYHFNSILNPRLAIEAAEAVAEHVADHFHLTDDGNNPNSAREEGDTEEFSDFQSANEVGVVDASGWESRRNRHEDDDYEEYASLMTGSLYVSSRTLSSSSSNNRGNNSRENRVGNNRRNRGRKFVGLRTWAKYVKKRCADELRQEREQLADEWRRFRQRSGNAQFEVRDDTLRRGETQEEIQQWQQQHTELKTLPTTTSKSGDSDTATDINDNSNSNNPYYDDGIDGDDSDDEVDNVYDFSQPTTTSTEGYMASPPSSPTRSSSDATKSTTTDEKSNDDDNVDVEQNSSENMKEIELEQQLQQQQQQQQEKNKKETKEDKHLQLLRQTLEELEQDRLKAISEKGPNDMKVGAISRKAGLLSIKLYETDRGMLLLREYVRIRTQNFGFDLDLDLANVLYMLGDYYSQEASAIVVRGSSQQQNGSQQRPEELDEDEKVKVKENLTKATRCWNGALKIYHTVGFNEGHVSVRNLKNKIEKVEKGWNEYINPTRGGGGNQNGARRRAPRWRSWVGRGGGANPGNNHRNQRNSASVTTNKAEMNWC
mmetsp:Transcript_38394/g.57525  ORF Transcript_38394/g.57525 Transcript_38394/m.57525 type:complete len:581 (-) Transcript_38394:205-1947(-)